MQSNKKKYCLYAFPYSEEAQEEALKHRFNRINGAYILVYEEDNIVNTSKSEYHIIEENEIGYLTESEKMWLLECNIQIITEESLVKQDEILTSFGEKLERLERELEREAEEIERGTERNKE